MTAPLSRVALTTGRTGVRYDVTGRQSQSHAGGAQSLPPLQETLMGSMMARSTPRVLFQSPVVKHTVTFLEFVSFMQALAILFLFFSLHVRFVRWEGCASRLPPAIINEDSNANANININNNANSNNNEIIELKSSIGTRYRFSRERGFLLLSDASLRKLNVSIMQLYLPRDDPCLGGPLSHSALERLVGYDTVVVNAFARTNSGYVLALNSRRVINLNHVQLASMAPSLSSKILWKFGAVLTAVFIVCTTGALVAFTLKEVQVRMIKLTMDLQLSMRYRHGYGRIILRYALDALVFVPIVAGMLFFLFEFFDDQALAFAVLCIAWLCEFAASGSTRHWVSRLYLPRLFFCYFGGFHLYFFSFPLGFTWIALATSIAFMLHAALTVWNRCELPLLRTRDRSVRQRWR